MIREPIFRRRIRRTLCGLAAISFFFAVAAHAEDPPPPSPRLIKVQEDMADLYEGKGELASALAIYRRLHRALPRELRYLQHISRLTFDMGKVAESLEPTKALLARTPNDPKLRRRLLDIYNTLKRPRAGFPHLEWLAQRAPGDVALTREYAEALEEQKKHAAALQVYDRLAKLKISAKLRLEIDLTRAGILATLGKERQYAKLVETLRKKHPKNLAVRCEYGDYLAGEDDLHAAQREVQALNIMAPHDPRVQALRLRLAKRVAQERERAWKARLRAERWADWARDLQLRAEDF